MTEERLKTWLGFAQFFLGTVALGIVTLLVNRSIQEREVELKEQELSGTFLIHAINEDVGVRHRLAQYFSMVTRSDAIRDRWEEYAKLVQAEYDSTLAEKRKLEEEAKQESLSTKEKDALFDEIAALERALRPQATAESSRVASRVYLLEKPFLLGRRDPPPGGIDRTIVGLGFGLTLHYYDYLDEERAGFKLASNEGVRTLVLSTKVRHDVEMSGYRIGLEMLKHSSDFATVLVSVKGTVE